MIEIKSFKVLSEIRDVIAASDPRHDNKKPQVDISLLRESLYELVALHLEGKSARHPAMQDILDLVVAELREAAARKSSKARNADHRFARLVTIEIQQAILRIERQIAEL